MGVRKGWNGHLLHTEIEIRDQKCLEILKSTASISRITDLILAMTVYLPVWHSHCTSVRFTVLVSCSDEFAVHSCSLFCLERQVRKLWTDCSTVGVYCVTIPWPKIDVYENIESTNKNIFF